VQFLSASRDRASKLGVTLKWHTFLLDTRSRVALKLVLLLYAVVNSKCGKVAMGRPSKVTKHSLLNALSHSVSIAQAARYLDVDRHTVYDAAKRFGVDLSTALNRFPTVPHVYLTQEPSGVPPVVDSPPIKPERDIRRLTADDFNGTNWRNSNGLRFTRRWPGV